MRRPPERGRQVLKLARQDYFQVAWDLHGFAEALGYIAPDAHRTWARAIGRIGSKGPIIPGEAESRQGRRSRPRRSRRRKS
jgi:hypothetical protein